MASSDTARKTQEYAESVRRPGGQTLIANQDIPVKSPDIARLDFFGFGFLKQRTFHRRATTLSGLWKVLNEEWNKITPEKRQEVLSEWKKRYRLVVKKKGFHIEQVIHNKKVKL